MSSIQSVTGELAGADLGFVLVHEHVAASSPGIIQSWPALFGGRSTLAERGTEALLQAAKAGVRTIVDCTTFDLGRDVALLAEVSAKSGISIIAVTGLWLDPSVTLKVRSVDQLTDLFLSDLTQGMDGTEVRAGVIKIAHEESIDPMGELILQAAARACVLTGAPIITHTAARHRVGDKQAALLEHWGVDPARVAIGHSDDSPDVEYLVGLASRGYWIAMDRMPNGKLSEYGGQTVDDRISMIVTLLERGYGRQLLLGHDDPIWAGVLSDSDQNRHLESNPQMLAFISEVVLPALAARGVSPEAIRQITESNPRRWLCGS